MLALMATKCRQSFLPSVEPNAKRMRFRSWTGEAPEFAFGRVNDCAHYASPPANLPARRSLSISGLIHRSLSSIT